MRSIPCLRLTPCNQSPHPQTVHWQSFGCL